MREKRALPVAAMLLCALSMSAESIDGLQNWTAPPYWTPQEAVPKGSGEEREAAASGRRALAASPVPLPFIALTPCRVADTRSAAFNSGAFLNGTPSLQGSTARGLYFKGLCGIPADARAVSVNVTVVAPTAAGWLSLWPSDKAWPGTSTLNFPAGVRSIANAAVVPLSGCSSPCADLDVLSGIGLAESLDLVLDVNGYYSPLGIVNSLNTLAGDITLAAGSNVTITPSGQTLTIAAISGGGAPTGPAGGSLSGTYPNPGIASGAVGAAQLANNTAVRSINGAAQDLVTIQGSGDVTVATAGSTITIGALSGSMALGAPGDTTLIGAGYAEIAPNLFDYWTATAAAGAPSVRQRHTAVWTGSRMIVWGGFDGGSGLSDGGQYDPVGNAWTATTTTGAPSGRALHTAVWTGSRMIVWGGSGSGLTLNDGGQYDPVGDMWTATSTAGAPSVRYDHTAVWTGSRMVVWGGFSGSSYLNDGGRYDPVGNAWTATTPTGAPAGRAGHTAVWAGSRMIVWGGESFGGYRMDGGVYEPGRNVWGATTTTGAPSARRWHTAVWTGSRMIVWGGFSSIAISGSLNDGGQYDPVGNAWTTTTVAAAPMGRSSHTAVWTGSRMIVWGGSSNQLGFLNDGGQYDPAGDTWTVSTAAGTPSVRQLHTAVWTGSRMIVWGGFGGSGYRNDGAQWRTVSLYVKN